MAQAVSHRPLTAEARVRFRVSGICGEQSGTGTGFSPSTSVFPYQFHFTGDPLLGKTKKKTIFITGMHNKPQCCGTSVASAAGPFTNKIHTIRLLNTSSVWASDVGITHSLEMLLLDFIYRRSLLKPLCFGSWFENSYTEGLHNRFPVSYCLYEEWNRTNFRKVKGEGYPITCHRKHKGWVEVRGATQKFPKFECRAKTACSTVVGL
jgi:hypothetical protein